MIWFATKKDPQNSIYQILIFYIWVRIQHIRAQIYTHIYTCVYARPRIVYKKGKCVWMFDVNECNVRLLLGVHMPIYYISIESQKKQ